MTRDEARYLRAFLTMRHAWEQSQPQLVLDGWTSALEATDPPAHLRVGSLERASTSLVARSTLCGTEPHSDTSALRSGLPGRSRIENPPSGGRVGAAQQTNKAGGTR